MAASWYLLRLLTVAYLVCSCLSSQPWLLQIRNTLLRRSSLEYLQSEKVRLTQVVQDLNRAMSVLLEENMELTKNVKALNLKVYSLRKKELLLRSDHRNEVSELEAKHVKSVAELQDSFRKFRSKEIASMTSKLKEQHDLEKRDLRASLEAAHATEVSALKELISSSKTSLQQRDMDVAQLKEELVLSRVEIETYAERVKQGLVENEALKEVSNIHEFLRKTFFFTLSTTITLLVLLLFSIAGSQDVV